MTTPSHGEHVPDQNWVRPLFGAFTLTGSVFPPPPLSPEEVLGNAHDYMEAYVAQRPDVVAAKGSISAQLMKMMREGYIIADHATGELGLTPQAEEGYYDALSRRPHIAPFSEVTQAAEVEPTGTLLSWVKAAREQRAAAPSDVRPQFSNPIALPAGPNR